MRQSPTQVADFEPSRYFAVCLLYAYNLFCIDELQWSAAVSLRGGREPLSRHYSAFFRARGPDRRQLSGGVTTRQRSDNVVAKIHGKYRITYREE
jgi:hypothetical protein